MSFWENKKVLVTGANGFIGSNLVRELIIRKALVTTLYKNNSLNFSGLISQDILKKIYSQEKSSVTDFEKVNRIVKENNIEIIFHLAAQPIVEIGKVSPLDTFEVNIKGTWNILESARENKVQKLIIASTAHVYGDNSKVPLKEAYYPQPSRPYETSKACADLLAQTYADSYNLPVEIPRFVNTYGPGDFNFTRLIPKIIRTLLVNETPQVWDIGTVRDFLFIDDVTRAYLMLAEKQIPNIKRVRVFNFGTGKPINIYELVEKIITIMGKENVKLQKQLPPKERFQEIKKQYVSIAKAKRELGWVPKVSLDEGLKKTIDWYKANSKSFI